MIELRAGRARALVGPEQGAALAALELCGLPILRPLKAGQEEDPFAWAMNILAPFSNRVSVPILVEGEPVQLTPNLPGERFPIHGDAFQRPWEIVSQSPDTIDLRLRAGAFGPLRYEAELTYRLFPDRLELSLVLRNRARSTLPFGAGFHPWFPRSYATRVAFASACWWPENDLHLPQTSTPVQIPEALDFKALRPLPAHWINAGFADWDGTAVIEQGRGAVSCRLISKDLSTLLFYSPGDAADFFCLEPVSHPVDAHALPGHPGLRFLRSDETMACSMSLTWGEDDARDSL